MKNLKLQIKDLQKNQKGFTLIELLIVIVIIAALAVTVFTALNPVKRVKDAHDSRRAADVETILSAIHEYIVDNNGATPANMPPQDANFYQLGSGASGCNLTTTSCTIAATACKDLFGAGGAGTLGSYLKSMPIDPLGAPYSATNTGYAINYSATGIVTVKACAGENNTNIQQSR